MSDNGTGGRAETGPDATPGAEPTSRRRALMLGAAGASMVVTIRPALAQTATSVLTCEIPIPQPWQAGGWIAPDGRVVFPGTKNAVRPPSRPLKGEDVRKAIRNNTSFPGTTREQTTAYTRYMQKLQAGNSGFTCFVSIRGR